MPRYTIIVAEAGHLTHLQDMMLKLEHRALGMSHGRTIELISHSLQHLTEPGRVYLSIIYAYYK
jgi:hypothetical protein